MKVESVLRKKMQVEKFNFVENTCLFVSVSFVFLT